MGSAGGTLPDQCGVPLLRGPDGAVVTSGCVFGGKGGVNPISLQSGQYTVEVNPAERNVGQVRLTLTT